MNKNKMLSLLVAVLQVTKLLLFGLHSEIVQFYSNESNISYRRFADSFHHIFGAKIHICVSNCLYNFQKFCYKWQNCCKFTYLIIFLARKLIFVLRKNFFRTNWIKLFSRSITESNFQSCFFTAFATIFGLMWNCIAHENLIPVSIKNTTQSWFGLEHYKMSSLLFFLLFVSSVFGQETPRPRTCQQSLIAGLKAIFQENGNEACVSKVLNGNFSCFLTLPPDFRVWMSWKLYWLQCLSRLWINDNATLVQSDLQESPVVTACRVVMVLVSPVVMAVTDCPEVKDQLEKEDWR